MLTIHASGPSWPRFDSQCSQKFLFGKHYDVAEVNQWRWLEGSEQWLENVDQTNLVLASGKPALQKIYWKGGTVAEWSETLLL